MRFKIFISSVQSEFSEERRMLANYLSAEGQATERVRRLLSVFNNKETLFNINEIMKFFSLKHRPTFLYTYLQPAIEQGLVAMKYPQTPNHPKQKYYLTEKGFLLIKQKR